MNHHHHHAVHPRFEHLVSPKHNVTNENQSQAHQMFRQIAGNTKATEHTVTGFTNPSSTGVLYASDRATANGWTFGDKAWANLGQGAPETSKIPGGSERLRSIVIDDDSDLEYAPANGTIELRKAVADYYNSTYRVGKISQYSVDNIAIVPGGRAGLTRLASIISKVYCLYTTPEYTAYSEMLSSFGSLIPIAMATKAEDSFTLNIDELKSRIAEAGVSVVALSNPRNPTGNVIQGAELQKLVSITQDQSVSIIHDEFYSHYLYSGEPGDSVSAALYVKDVNEEETIILNGMTKGFRLPGLRVAWVVGPRALIKSLSACGGFLDGGASHVMQNACVQFLEPQRVIQDRLALQAHFKMKRDHVVARLNEMGFQVKAPPATFYLWLDLSKLPSPLNSGLVFFEECLKEKVILVLGIGFDISPIHRNNLFASPFHHYVRLSFGPSLIELDRGLDGIQRVIAKVTRHVEGGGDIHDVVGKDLAPHKDTSV